jgi:hypothetical protein
MHNNKYVDKTVINCNNNKKIIIRNLRLVLGWQENISLFFFFLFLVVKETAGIAEDSVRISTFPASRAGGQRSC